MLSAGIVLLLLYLTEGPLLGWLSVETFAFLIPGLALTGYFFAFENKTTSPLIQMSLLRTRNILVANIIGLTYSIATFIITYATIYFAELPKPFGLGLNVISTGLTFVPASLGSMLLALIVGKMVPKVGPKPMILVGSFAMILSFIMLIVGRSSFAGLALVVVLAYSGVTTVAIASTNMLAMAWPKEATAVGQGVNQMLKSFGQGIGPVIATAIMASFTAPLISTIGGQAVIVSQLPASMAFNVLSIAGVAFVLVIMVTGFATKNYTFNSQDQKDAGW
jgi:MFS family permease